MSLPNTSGHIKSDADAQEQGISFAALWLQKIERQRKAEEDWRDQAEAAESLYEGDDANTAFNILHSNVETIVPAVYNSTPVPDVRRRYSDADPVAKLVVDICERAINYQLDQYEFDDEIEAVITDALVAGRGTIRLRYSGEPQPDGTISDQRVWCEYVPWRSFVMGPGRRWRDVPWIAFEHALTQDEIDQLRADAPMGEPAEVEANDDRPTWERNARGGHKSAGQDKGIYQTAVVYEVWDRDTRQIYWVSEQDRERPLSISDDVLGLENFFCVPPPLQRLRRASSLVPICPNTIVMQLTEELDTVTRRINALAKLLQVKGGVAGSLSRYADQVATLDDGEMAVFDETYIGQGIRIDDLIHYWPIEQIAATIQQLEMQRERTKQTIYEVTGISDIVRGVSEANETATAQQIKSQWGSVRVQRLQRQIQNTIRDLFRMKVEVIAANYQPEAISQMTALPAKPEDQEAFPQAIQLLQSPDMRGFRVDVETDSTIRADMTRSQEQMNLFMQVTSQFLPAAMGALQQAPQLAVPLVEVYTAFCRQFRLGKQAEDALDGLQQQVPQAVQQMMQAQQPQDDPKQKAEMAKLELEGEQSRELHQMAMAEKRLDFELKQAEAGQRMQERAAQAFDGYTNGQA